jgi:alkylation response protein AidB-like acyl-CoA dehydrogenase
MPGYRAAQAQGRALLGAPQEGWSNITRYTLNFERASITKTGMLLRVSDDLIAHVRAGGAEAGRLRRELAEVRAEIVACRWLGYKVAWLYDQGQVPTSESSMIKVLTTDLVYRLAALGADILGYASLLRGREAQLEGRIEHMLRSVWFHLVGGGAPDIQRNIVAQRGLGLPRD